MRQNKDIRRVLLLVAVFVVGGVLFAADQAIPDSLQKILAGSSSDGSAIGSIGERDLPTALSVIEALKFRAVHHDVAASNQDVAALRKAIEARLAKARTVSLAKTASCSIPVPARRVNIDGNLLEIPAHFIAPLDLAITGFGPQGEAGTMLPDFWVSFSAASEPVRAVLTLDSRKIELATCGDHMMGSRLPATASSLLALGTHSATLVITDPTGNQASTTWKFTVGVAPTATTSLPEGSRVVASFPVSLASSSKALTVVVHETPDGRRVCEYVVYDKKTGATMRSFDPAWVRRMTDGRRDQDPTLTITPRTSLAFPGNVLTFGFVYAGPGDVKKTSWQVTQGGETTDSEGPTVQRTLDQSGLSAMCTVDIVEALPGGGETQVSLSASKTIRAMWPNEWFQNQADGLFNPNGTGSIPLNSSRVLISDDPYNGQQLVQGQDFDLGGGRVTVNTAALKIVGGEGVKIEDPATLTTWLHFEKPGTCEIVHDISLTYAFQGETYRSQFRPRESMLAGVFITTGEMTFAKVPPGMLDIGSRKVTVGKISVTIAGRTRQTTTAVLSAPWVIAESALFPKQPPLRIDHVLPGFRGPTGFEFASDFRPSIWILEGDPVENGHLTFQPLIQLVPNFVRARAEPAVVVANNQLDMPVYSVFDVLSVETTPPGPVTLREGQQLSFKGTIVPKSGLGTGHVDSSGGTLNLLDGYVFESVDSLAWDSYFVPPEPPAKPKRKRTSDWTHVFKPDQGTGSYVVVAVAGLNVRDTDADNSVLVFGQAMVPITVEPGLKIVSPQAGSAYPQGAEILVKTNLDSDESAEWEKIKWTVNGKPWKPEQVSPPFKLALSGNAKNWTITAELPLPDGTSLHDSVGFSAVPVSVSITPSRRVFDYSSEKAVPLELKVRLGQTDVHNVTDSVVWVPGSTTAMVSNVEWSVVTVPESIVGLTVQPNPFMADAEFTSSGALTALATLTILVQSIPGAPKPASESFCIPAARADLWAVPQPAWTQLNSNLEGGLFPTQAIAPAGRTFSIKDGVISLNKDSYDWSSQSGFPKPIALYPAIPDPNVLPARCDSIKFKWIGPDSQTSGTFSFIPAFKKPGMSLITLQSGLLFDKSVEIRFADRGFGVDVTDIETLVEHYVEPRSFEMTVGETRKFSFVVKTKAPPPPPPAKAATNTRLSLLNGIYNLTIESVEWHYESASETTPLETTIDYSFSPTYSGAFAIFGAATCRLEEAVSSAKRQSSSSVWISKGSSNGNVVGKPKITFYVDDTPLTDASKIYLGQKVRLSFTASLNDVLIPIENYSWIIDPPFTSEFRTVGAEQAAGEVVPGKDEKNQPVEFLVYSFNRSDKKKSFLLHFDYKGIHYEEKGEIPILGPTIDTYGYRQLVPEIYPLTGTGGTAMRLGYHPQLEPGDQPAHVGLFTAKNPTEIKFAFYYAQLISWQLSRGFESGAEEYVDVSRKWLDRGFPYVRPGVEEFLVVSPNGSVSSGPDVQGSFMDSPSFVFQENATLPDPLWYKSKTNFSVFVFVRPNIPNGTLVPVLRYDWYWRADAERSGSTWTLVDGSFFPISTINLATVTEIPLGITDQNCDLGFPIWVDKFDKVLPWKKR